ncbi:PadR family transcriptional regulator PadR [Anaerotaenia torta]|uniref:PadR family transcriptional regulator n=1 Tax=Anaerotaenia torta TaxID=433293 RepID=UPI003D19BE69
MIDKSLIAGSTTTLILKLLEEQDMYGYQMIEALAEKSDDTFHLKAGTLYPILHGLEKEGMVDAYEEKADGAKLRKYYHLTSRGRRLLEEKQQEWKAYTGAVNKVLNGGAGIAVIG